MTEKTYSPNTKLVKMKEQRKPVPSQSGTEEEEILNNWIAWLNPTIENLKGASVLPKLKKDYEIFRTTIN